MVAFPVQFRLYLHGRKEASKMPPLLLVVDVLAVDVLVVVKESGLYRKDSRMVPVVLVVPALGVAVA